VSAAPLDEALATLRGHTRVVVRPESLDIRAPYTHQQHRLLRRLLVLGSATLALALLLLFSGVATISASLSRVLVLILFAVFVGGIGLGEITSRLEPWMRISGAMLRIDGQPLPLEGILSVTVARDSASAELHLETGDGLIRLPLNQPDLAEPLAAFLRLHVDRRKAVLLAEGHDISTPALIPPEVSVLRER